MTEFVHVGSHADTLAGSEEDGIPSRDIGPGDIVGEHELTEADHYLIEEGRLVDAESFDGSQSNEPGTGEAQSSEPLTGEALKKRASDLDIQGRSDMNADELRQAIADAEAQGGEV